MPLAVPTPGTFVPGIVDSAAFLNANVRDAVTFLKDPPLCAIYASSVQAMANNAWTSVNHQVNRIDSYAGHSTVTNTSRYVAQVAGWYDVGFLAVLTLTTVNPAARLAINGTPVLGSPNAGAVASGTGLSTACASGPVFLNVGDFVEGQVYQNSGGSVNSAATGTDFTSSMWVRFIHS